MNRRERERWGHVEEILARQLDTLNLLVHLTGRAKFKGWPRKMSADLARYPRPGDPSRKDKGVGVRGLARLLMGG